MLWQWSRIHKSSCPVVERPSEAGSKILCRLPHAQICTTVRTCEAAHYERLIYLVECRLLSTRRGISPLVAVTEAGSVHYHTSCSFKQAIPHHVLRVASAIPRVAYCSPKLQLDFTLRLRHNIPSITDVHDSHEHDAYRIAYWTSHRNAHLPNASQNIAKPGYDRVPRSSIPRQKQQCLILSRQTGSTYPPHSPPSVHRPSLRGTEVASAAALAPTPSPSHPSESSLTARSHASGGLSGGKRKCTECDVYRLLEA